MENIHSEMYSLLIDTYGHSATFLCNCYMRCPILTFARLVPPVKDPTEKERLLLAIETVRLHFCISCHSWTQHTPFMDTPIDGIHPCTQRFCNLHTEGRTTPLSLSPGPGSDEEGGVGDQVDGFDRDVCEAAGGVRGG
eukprot:736749-Rhodomonas_salina.1